MSMMSKVLTDSPAIAMLAESDFEKGRRFWGNTLGFQEVEYQPDAGAYYRAGQGTIFGIYPHEGGSKADHTQLSFVVQDVLTTMQSLQQQGVMFEEYDLPGVKTVNGIASLSDGTKGAWFKDPGGNIVGIFTLTPATAQKLQSSMSMAGAGAGMGGGMGTM